ncbi:uncharacterized protein LOC132550329 [Ylistrum balloti]|uniref:uncharacterized protein LOC132550329 n=1 Tax=Ylistrum balloti TaxID=509963 RepID=UPI002905CB46|nr:uncharacterized protein LOC132550329 [Ylistrum balloti]
MAAISEPVLKWSDEKYRIKDLIGKFTLPLMVKVEEGIYGLRESESFSQDDLLKLELIKTIPKLITCCVDYTGRIRGIGTLREDEHGYIERSDDLTIPVRYRGMVKIFQPEGTRNYNSVGDMIKGFPRYVKTVDSFVSRNGINIEKETIIQLQRFIPGKGLVCTIGKDHASANKDSAHVTQILLNSKDRHRFVLIPDDNSYTLEEVVNRFPLPQYVTFVKKGGPKLVTTNIEELVNHSRIFEGAVKIKSMVDVDVIIGHYKPPKGVSSTTQKRCQRTLVIIPENSVTAREIEVRVPLNDDDDYDYELVMARNFSCKDVQEEDIDGTVYMDFLKTPNATFIEYDEIEIPPPSPPPLPKRHRQPSTEAQDRRQPEQMPIKTKGDYYNQDMFATNSDEESDDDYEKIIDEVPLGMTDDDKKLAYFDVQGALSEKIPEDYRFSLKRVLKELRKLRRTGKEKEPSEPPSTPQTVDQSQSKSDSRKWFEKLGSNDLYRHFTNIKLDKLAIWCRDEGLNGSFFNNLTDENLQKNFKLSPIQILKFRRFQNDGWMPN